MGEPERDWVAAADAVDMVLPLYERPALAQAALVSEAAANRLATRCERFEFETDRPGGRGVFNDKGTQLTIKFWRDFEVARREREDWLVGAFIFSVEVDIFTQWTRAFGVEFCANDVHRVFRLKRTSAAGPPTEAAQRAYNPRPVGTLEEIAPGLAPFRNAPAEPLKPPTPKRPRRDARPRKRVAKAPVPHDEFMGWFRSLPDADQANGYRWIWSEAKRYFQPRRVPKKYATEIVRGRDLGRKRKA